MVTVLLTRSEVQSVDWRYEFERRGVVALLQPVIEIFPVSSWELVDDVVLRICEFDWVLFSSGNGVRFFLSRFCGGVKFPAAVRVGVVGGVTGDIFFECAGRRADILPETSNAEGLLAKILSELSENIAGKKFLLPRGNRGRDILSSGISAAGGIVEEVVVYESVDCKTAKSEIIEAMQSGQIDWVTATSPAIAESLVNMFGNLLNKTKIISISPLTTQKLKKLGFPPKKEAKQTTKEAIINEILS
ncbi:MAG: uroporphyrinogen-III synthase [Planctomycetaceae bacterium]|jgi:uroporphyrinogen III methyltransferase/synthase|nr:uroporphyrinogen-III synthase [Planctomycetaceae bacterium]